MTLGPAARAEPPETSSKPVSGAGVVVEADATDDVGVMGVQFLLNGSPLGPEDRTYPYSTVWDTTATPDGVHILTARARDAAGNESISGPVDVLVDNAQAEDTTSPTVATTAPMDGSTVSARVAVRAEAADDFGIAGVEFLLDGYPLGPEDTLAPWEIEWDTTRVANGIHTLVTRARDEAGNLATSGTIAVTVDNPLPDDSPPRVTMTTPGDGEVVSGPVAVSAEASDDVGVVGVQMLLDGMPLGFELGMAPYSLAWDTTLVGDGTHLIAARARDAAGNETVSSPVAVTVTNEPAAVTEGSGEDGANGVPADARVEVSLERDGPADTIIIRARSDVDAIDHLVLSIDGTPAASGPGSSLDYVWNTRPLVGFHEIRVIAFDASMQPVTSSSVYQIEVAPASKPGKRQGQTGATQSETVLLAVTGGGAGAVSIQAGSTLRGIRAMDLRIDQEPVAASRNGKPIEFQWDRASLTGFHEVTLVAYDRTGVLAVASVFYRWEE